MTNNGLAGWANSKRFFKFLTASACHPGQFWSESFDMLSFFLDKTTWNKQREVGIEYPSLLEPSIHESLNILPYGIAIWPNDHTASHRRIVSKFSLTHYLVIPL